MVGLSDWTRAPYARDVSALRYLAIQQAEKPRSYQTVWWWTGDCRGADKKHIERPSSGIAGMTEHHIKGESRYMSGRIVRTAIITGLLLAVAAPAFAADAPKTKADCEKAKDMKWDDAERRALRSRRWSDDAVERRGNIGVVATVARLRSRTLGTDMSMLSKTRPSCAGLARGGRPARAAPDCGQLPHGGLSCSACPQRLWISER